MSNYDFFISYSSKDSELVEAIIGSLETMGASCWYAPRNVTGRYAKSIVDAIENSRIFLLCLSKSAAKSDHVLNEIEVAYNKKRAAQKDLIIEPLRLDSLDLDDPEFDEIMYYIRRINFISPSNVESANIIANEIISRNRQYLAINEKPLKKERSTSLYFSSERENKRLESQSKLLKKFDGEIYKKIIEEYDFPAVLDIGCGNGDLIIDRLQYSKNGFSLIGIDKDVNKVEEANTKHGNQGAFISGDVEGGEFIDDLIDVMEQKDIPGFDIINISMLLLHLKSYFSLLRKCRRLLLPGGKLIIKDIDDGLNYVYPDEDESFAKIIRMCDNNETSGERQNGRQIYTNLFRAGFNDINLEKSGFTTIGAAPDEKEIFWEIYFKFIFGDIQWMHNKYPSNLSIKTDCEWYSANYERLHQMFMKEDLVFSIGFQIYTASK